MRREARGVAASRRGSGREHADRGKQEEASDGEGAARKEHVRKE